MSPGAGNNAGVALADDYAALRHEVGAVWLPRDVLRVSGPDAVSWLQGQLSQDVAALAVGQSADSFLLEPQGKVDALVRVTRTASAEIVLDVDAGFGEAVTARLQRFKLRVKAELEALAWRCLALRGPAAAGVATGEAGGIVVPTEWPGLAGVDVLGESPVVPAGVRECGLEAWEAVRIEAGIPVMGRELTERTIPEEAGIVDRTVSFTKGCYTGQELVARIDSRGRNVARRLRGIVVDAGADAGAPPEGAVVLVGGKEVGTLTSAARSPALGAVGLAYVRREVEPPADAEMAWDGSAVAARVASLPLVG